MRIRVVFPDPLCPMIVRDSPGWTVRSSPRRTSRSPKDLESLSTETAALAPVALNVSFPLLQAGSQLLLQPGALLPILVFGQVAALEGIVQVGQSREQFVF